MGQRFPLMLMTECLGQEGRLVAVPEMEITGEWVWEWLDAAAAALTYRAPQVAAELLRRALAQLAANGRRS